MEKKLIPYSVYLRAEYVKQLRKLAKKRQASSLVRDAVKIILDGNDVYVGGYNQGIRDASKVVYDCPEAQMVAVSGKDLGAHLQSKLELMLK